MSNDISKKARTKSLNDEDNSTRNTVNTHATEPDNNLTTSSNDTSQNNLEESQKDDQQSTEEREKYILDYKGSKKLKLYNKYLYKTSRRKIKILNSWLELVTQLDKQWFKAKQMHSLNEYTNLFILLDATNKRDLKKDVKLFKQELEEEYLILCEALTHEFLNLFKNTDFILEGAVPHFVVSRKMLPTDEGTNRKLLNILILKNPTRKDKEWLIEIEGQKIAGDDVHIVEKLFDVYDYYYYQTITNLNMPKLFLLVMQQIAFFSRQEQVQIYLNEFLNHTREFLVYNNFLASEDFVKKQFEEHFNTLVQQFGCKLDHARDKKKFVKLLIDGKEADYSYLIYNKKNLMGDPTARTEH